MLKLITAVRCRPITVGAIRIGIFQPFKFLWQLAAQDSYLVGAPFEVFMEILYKSKNAVVVYKPPLIPSQPDPSGDEDIMTMTSRALRELGEVDKLWLVHRLDRVVGGIMVFARNGKAAAELSKIFADEESNAKTYLAVLEGKICDGVMTDYIYKDKLKNKAYITDRARGGVKQCTLEAKTLAVAASGYSLVEIKLHTGRFHQIRAQMSHRGASVLGDKKYGGCDRGAHTPALFAYKLDIKISTERICVKKLPNMSEYPWSLFDTECIE